MAGASNLWQRFPKVLSNKREILEENISLELTSSLIACGIIEPSDQDKLKQIRKSRGLRESQKEFADILIKKKTWTEKEVADFKSCLEESSDEFMIERIFDEEDVEEIGNINSSEDSEEEKTFQSGDGFRAGPGNNSIFVKGNHNRIVNNSTVTINNR